MKSVEWRVQRQAMTGDLLRLCGLHDVRSLELDHHRNAGKIVLHIMAAFVSALLDERGEYRRRFKAGSKALRKLFDQGISE